MLGRNDYERHIWEFEMKGTTPGTKAHVHKDPFRGTVSEPHYTYLTRKVWLSDKIFNFFKLIKEVEIVGFEEGIVEKTYSEYDSTKRDRKRTEAHTLETYTVYYQNNGSFTIQFPDFVPVIIRANLKQAIYNRQAELLI